MCKENKNQIEMHYLSENKCCFEEAAFFYLDQYFDVSLNAIFYTF